MIARIQIKYFHTFFFISTPIRSKNYVNSCDPKFHVIYLTNIWGILLCLNGGGNLIANKH